VSLYTDMFHVRVADDEPRWLAVRTCLTCGALVEQSLADLHLLLHRKAESAPPIPAGWVECACGEVIFPPGTLIAPGVRAEIGGVSHGETPCYACDTYGNPIVGAEQ
jgi:hypothetical protein